MSLAVDLIPAARSIRTYHGAAQDPSMGYVLNGIKDHSGIGLIDELFKLQQPVLGSEKDKERFDQINDFMRDITGNDSVQLEIPHDRSAIYVNMDGKRLDLDALGSGIEQVLIIAAKSTMFSKQIVCIEEPEIYLHPTLQRKLIYYLNEKTDNQYFIATHSANFMDAAPCSIYHFKLEDGYSAVSSVLNDREKFLACVDLGYKASDILQSNFIVWVEGPSDRLYIKHWLRAVDQELKENLHYSIMFYGGRLLSHLSGSDEALEDFIMLQKLNRNAAIVIDSDRNFRGERVNSTKNRVKNEFSTNNQFVWITNGKEIENYISEVSIYSAIKNAHPSVVVMGKYDPYSDLTTYWVNKRKSKKSIRKIDKLKVAHKIISEKADLTILDLEAQTRRLAQFIRSANLLKV